MTNLFIEASVNTFLKKSTAQAVDLPSSEKVFCPPKKTYKILSICEIAESAYSFVELDYNAGSWYIYTPHWLVVDKDSQQYHKKAKVDEIDWNDMSTQLTRYFSLGELLRYDPRRVPSELHIKQNILKITYELDKIRREWGSPIIITSGYRPPLINRQVGGVSNSRHLVGDAVDIAPLNKSIRHFEKWLDVNWYGALGYGSKNGFVHLDMRNNKGFRSGGKKGTRWDYS